MFEYLSFEEVAFMACLNRKIKLDFSDGQLLYQYSDLINGEKEGTITENVEEFVKAIEDLHIEKWEKEYKPDYEILDGLGWTLSYKEVGKRTKHIVGSNAYPENYEAFHTLVYSMISEKIKEIAQ